jgi:alpha-D-ribose 1-methylphosphonate 5-triphosphate synthase subunit PhnG
MPDASANTADPVPRRRWMGLLARASRAELEAAWRRLAPPPSFAHVRKPETGLVLVRGRAGGTGPAFNLGEMTMTRCAVRVEAARRLVGLSYVAGRDVRRAELAAVFDALLQDPERAAEIETAVIAPIEMRLAGERAAQAAEVAATKVDFFTLVREQGA